MACALFAASAWVLAAGAIESRPVHFAKGASSTTVKGTLKSDKTIDYKLGAKAGQTMSVTLKTSNGANYTLTVGITGSAAPVPSLGAAPAGDAKVKGTPYQATGQVPCSMGSAPRGSAQCDYGVIRGKPGNAEVHVTPPGGFKRALTFVAGKVSADSGTGVMATRSGDLWSVDVNDYEHYRIPDAVISGG
jgi:hypothetical protein